MDDRPFVRRQAVLQAIFVTLLWSTSWIFIKFGLRDLPALTFAGLRYCLAFLCLLPFSLRRDVLASYNQLKPSHWIQLIILGLLYYSITQGAQYLALFHLPAATVSLFLNFTSLVVAILGIPLLREIPTFLQWAGAGLLLAGSLVYFYPSAMQGGQVTGFIIMTIGVIANALSSIFGRHLNRNSGLHPVVITTVSMGVGAIVLLSSGLVYQPLPYLSLRSWGIIIWLAVVNTAFAFTLWNHTLRTLTAMESSIINSTMLVQISILAWIFLDEQLTLPNLTGICMVFLGAILVQIQGKSLPTKSLNRPML